MKHRILAYATIGMAAVFLTSPGARAVPASPASILAAVDAVRLDNSVAFARRGGAYVGPRGGAVVHRGTAVVGPRGSIAVRRGTAVVGPGGGVAVRRGAWVRPGGYWWRPGGAVAAGAAIGFVTAATAAAWAGAAPGPNMCWYYTDATRTQGFWDACP